MTAVNGLRNKFRESFSAVGADVIYVSRMPWVIMNDFFLYRNRPPLQLREARALEDRMRGRAIVNPSVNSQRDLKYRDEVMEGIAVIGTTEKYERVSSATPEIGHFLTEFDVHFKRNVCVIGADIREGLFKNIDPLQKKVLI